MISFYAWLTKSFLSHGQSLFSVIERFEDHEGRNPGDTSTADLPAVLNLRKEICEAHV